MLAPLAINLLYYELSYKVVDPKEEMNPCFSALPFSRAGFLMHQLVTIIHHAVSDPTFITRDSMPCGHQACTDVRVSTWISSTCAVVGCVIDHINDSKGKAAHEQVTNDNNNKEILLQAVEFRETFIL